MLFTSTWSSEAFRLIWSALPWLTFSTFQHKCFCRWFTEPSESSTWKVHPFISTLRCVYFLQRCSESRKLVLRIRNHLQNSSRKDSESRASKLLRVLLKRIIQESCKMLCSLFLSLIKSPGSPSSRFVYNRLCVTYRCNLSLSPSAGCKFEETFRLSTR